MTLNLLATIIEVVAFECFAIGLMAVFNAFPSRWIKENAGFFMIIMFCASLYYGIEAGMIHIIDTHEVLFEHFIGALFPGMFLAIVLFLWIFYRTDNKQKTETIFLKAEEYKLVSDIDYVSIGSTQYQVKQYGITPNYVIYFTGAAPSEPADVWLIGNFTSNDVFVCRNFEVEKKQKKTKKEIIELIHTAILMGAGFCAFLPLIGAEIWKETYGVSLDNPFMDLMGGLWALVLFGGVRKLTQNAKGAFAKFWWFVVRLYYYIVLIEMILIPIWWGEI